MLYFFLMGLFASVIGGPDTNNNMIVSKCYSEGFLQLTCPSNSLIHVFNVTYGLSENGACAHNSTDCSLTEETSFGCNGRRFCEISILGQTRHNQQLPGCRKQGSYLSVQYECVPDADIVNICESEITEHIAGSGYIASPSYAAGHYSSFLNCQHRLAGTDITLYLITVNLTDSNDCLVLNNSQSTRTFCGGKGIIENYAIPLYQANRVSITFYTNAVGNNGGIWVYYKMRPLLIQERTTMTTQTPKPQTTVSQTSGTTAKSTTEIPVKQDSWTAQLEEQKIVIYNNMSNHISLNTLALILGLVFGGFFLLIVVLFAVYFTKRCKDRRQKQRVPEDGLDQISWCNRTNECLSSILSKHDNHIGYAYSCNILQREGNFNNYKHVQQSPC